MTNWPTGKIHFIPKSIQLHSSVAVTHTSEVSNSHRQVNPFVTMINAIILALWITELRGLSVGEKSKGIPIFEAGGIRVHRAPRSWLWSTRLVNTQIQMCWKLKLQCQVTWPYIYRSKLPPPQEILSTNTTPIKLNFSRFTYKRVTINL